MTPTGFEPAIPVSEPPQSHALDDTGTGTSFVNIIITVIIIILLKLIFN